MREEDDVCGVAVHECMNATKQKKKEKRKNKNVQFPKTICYFVILTTFHSFSVKRNEKSVFCLQNIKTSKYPSVFRGGGERGGLVRRVAEGDVYESTGRSM